METPCVRVERERGEETRRELAEANLLRDDREIVVEDGWLYVPVADPEAVPGSFEVVDHDVPRRETQTMPADLLGEEPSYERLGDIVIVDEDDPDRAREIADAIVASDLPVRTVLNRASKVKGDRRVRDWDVLATDEAEPDELRARTETVHREYGCEFALDVAQVYFSPRLATERHRVAEQVADDEHAFDMFAGVGPFVVPFAQRGADVVGVDINEVAIEYLRENARRNGVEDRVTAIHGDVRDVAAGDSDATDADYGNWADRVVMNLPHSADEFLDAAIRLASDDCVLHYYDIQHEDDPFGPGEAAIRAAAEPEYDVAVETRHVVRSYAPHELNVCLDVRLTR
ncbi:class I SAM-dependent methyltransferase [Halomicrococcus gelatinilyticus]|uniref:class I SAM-dependent methyltransferase n=1 Tax=Halomicrococcus gelatinilyticus TaxID=1702103 RepID=UPI002E15816E